jgi:hypothetical protein
MSDKLIIEERKIAPLDLEKQPVTKSWAEGFEKKRNKEFNETKQKQADILNSGGVEVSAAIPEDPRKCVLMVSLIRTRVRHVLFGPGRFENKNQRKIGIYHLWFPRDDYAEYELRKGNPPADVERPAHLKRRNLVIDLELCPQDAWDFVCDYEQHRKQRLSELSMKHKPKDVPRIIMPHM